jgi:hypothetical protein
MKEPVLRIREHFETDPDLRVIGSIHWIRILLFLSVAFKIPTKISFFPKVFCLLLFVLHLHQSTKIASHKEVTKQLKSRFFLIFWLVDGRILIRIQTRENDYGSRSSRPKSSGTLERTIGKVNEL